jgi:hypothetical protein
MNRSSRHAHLSRVIRVGLLSVLAVGVLSAAPATAADDDSGTRCVRVNNWTIICIDT